MRDGVKKIACSKVVNFPTRSNTHLRTKLLQQCLCRTVLVMIRGWGFSELVSWLEACGYDVRIYWDDYTVV